MAGVDDAFAAFEAEMEALPAPKAAAGPQAPKVIMAAPSGPTRRRSPSPPKGLPSHLPPSQWQSPDELASQIRADNPGVAMPQLGAAAPAAPGYGAPPPPPPPGYPGAMVPPPPPAGGPPPGYVVGRHDGSGMSSSGGGGDERLWSGAGLSSTGQYAGASNYHEGAAQAVLNAEPGGEKRKAPKRSAAGRVWTDETLADWPEDDFRIFVGDLGNETNDDVLAHAFQKYPSFQRARVVRDKHSGKTKGYGFVSFKDPWDMTKALRDMPGKYVGNRPIKVRKSSWKERNADTNSREWMNHSLAVGEKSMAKGLPSNESKRFKPKSIKKKRGAVSGAVMPW